VSFLKINHLPHVLYRFYDDRGRLLYVGVAADFLVRWRKHRKRSWWPQVARMEIAHYPDRPRVLAAERDAIRTERPLHNVQHNTGPAEQLSGWLAHVADAPWVSARPTVRLVRLVAASLLLAGLWTWSALAVEFFGMPTGSLVFLLTLWPWWRVTLSLLTVQVRVD
jgi:hypothetical protein